LITLFGVWRLLLKTDKEKKEKEKNKNKK